MTVEGCIDSLCWAGMGVCGWVSRLRVRTGSPFCWSAREAAYRPANTPVLPWSMRNKLNQFINYNQTPF